MSISTEKCSALKILVARDDTHEAAAEAYIQLEAGCAPPTLSVNHPSRRFPVQGQNHIAFVMYPKIPPERSASPLAHQP